MKTGKKLLKSVVSRLALEQQQQTSLYSTSPAYLNPPPLLERHHTTTYSLPTRLTHHRPSHVLLSPSPSSSSSASSSPPPPPPPPPPQPHRPTIEVSTIQLQSKSLTNKYLPIVAA
ncbi:hypothetical protein TPS_09579 [Trichinella pseudospiralis]